jgi:hypothetical protein
MLDKTKWMIQLGAAVKRVVRERLKKEWVQVWKKKKTSCLIIYLIQTLEEIMKNNLLSPHTAAHRVYRAKPISYLHQYLSRY